MGEATTTQTAAPDVTRVRQRLVSLSNRMFDQSQPYVAQFVVPAAAPTPPHERAIREAADDLPEDGEPQEPTPGQLEIPAAARP